MKDVMVDLETLGKNKDKAIVQIGAVYFDNVTGDLGQEFKVNVDAESHEALGGRLDANTVYWWLSQSDAARASILAQPRLPIVEAMNLLNDFLEPSLRIWSHATFDFVTLFQTYEQLRIKPKFRYKQAMDIRTLVWLAGVSTSSTERTGLHHDGLEDAKHQVKYCVEAMNKIKTNRKAIKLLSDLIE